MANVMLIEGWGLAGTGADYADYENNRKLAVLGWGLSSPTTGASAISIEEDPNSAGRLLSISGTSGAGALYRSAGVAGSSRICLGCQLGPTWAGYASRAGVGLVFSPEPFSSLLPAGAVQAGIARRNDGKFNLYEGSGFTEIEASAAQYIPSIPNWVELVVDLSANTVEWWLNSSLVVSQPLAKSYPAGAYIAATLGNAQDSEQIDGDGLSAGALYVADERLGRCQVITQRPSTDSAVEFSRPQGDSNASQVADPNGYDGDTTYVSSSTSGAEDLYGTDDPTGLTNERIHGVSVAVVGRKEDIGNRSITPVCAQGTAVAAGEPVTLEIGQYLGTQSTFSADPDSGLDWSLSGLNSSTFGVRLTD